VRSALVWNVRGLTSAGTASLHETHQFLDTFDFVFLSETQLIAPLSHLLPDHDLHSLPADTAGRPGEGLLLAIRRSLGLVTIPWPADPKSGTLWVQVQHPGSGERYMLGSCYIPPSASRQLRRLTADGLPLSAAVRGAAQTSWAGGGHWACHLGRGLECPHRCRASPLPVRRTFRPHPRLH